MVIQDVLWYGGSTRRNPIFPPWKSKDSKMHSWLQKNFVPASRIGKMASYHPPCAVGQDSTRWQNPPVLGESSLGTGVYIINEKLIFSTLNP